MAEPYTDESPAAPPDESPGALPDDWPARAADTVVRVVDQVRSKTTRPAILVSRVLVYGFVITFLALTLLVLLLVGLFRFTMLGGGEVYWRYFGWGAVLSLVGALLWSKRVAKT